MSAKLRVLHVDDSAVPRLFARRVLESTGRFDVTSVDSGGAALDAMASQSFDVLVTDWMMLEMDGLELIRRVRSHERAPDVIVMASSIDSPKARLHALNEGADGFIATPAAPEDYLRQIDETVARASAYIEPLPSEPRAALPTTSGFTPRFSAVGIAASTGGPNVVIELVRGLRPRTDTAYFIVVHGPAWMLEAFAGRLQRETEMRVALPDSRVPIQPGTIYLAPGGHHMIADERMTVGPSDAAPEHFLCPAADPTFRSLAARFGGRTVAVVATGLGADGTDGSRAIAEARGRVIVQDPEEAVASSMPRHVLEAGIDCRVVGHAELAVAVDTALDGILGTLLAR